MKSFSRMYTQRYLPVTNTECKDRNFNIAFLTQRSIFVCLLFSADRFCFHGLAFVYDKSKQQLLEDFRNLHINIK